MEALGDGRRLSPTEAVALLALFVLPAGALAVTVWRYSTSPTPPGLPFGVAAVLWLFVMGAAIAWLVAISTEAAYVVRALPAIASRSVAAG